MSVIDDQHQPTGLRQLPHFGTHGRLIVTDEPHLPAALVPADAASELERKTAFPAARGARDDEQLSAARDRVDDFRLPQLIPDQGSAVAHQRTAAAVHR